MYSEIKDIVVALAAILAAGSTFYAAFSGIRSWKKKLEWETVFSKEKLKWEVNSSVANQMLRFTYLLRDEICEFTRPKIRGKELPDDYKFCENLSNLPKEDKRKVLEHVYYSRLKALSIVLQSFKNETFKAKVLWGQSIKGKTNRLRNYVYFLEDNIEPYIKHFVENKVPHFSITGDKTIRMGIGDSPEEAEANLKKEGSLILEVDDIVKEIESEIKSRCMLLD